MKHSEALEIIRGLRRGIQRAQSTNREAHEGDGIDFLRGTPFELMRWSLGSLSLLPTLLQMEDRADRGEALAPMDVYNVLYVSTSLAPEIAVFYAMTESSVGGGVRKLPELDLSILAGWEPEQ